MNLRKTWPSFIKVSNMSITHRMLVGKNWGQTFRMSLDLLKAIIVFGPQKRDAHFGSSPTMVLSYYAAFSRRQFSESD